MRTRLNILAAGTAVLAAASLAGFLTPQPAHAQDQGVGASGVSGAKTGRVG